MTESSIFKTIYVVGIVSAFLIRLPFRVRSRGEQIAEARFRGLEISLLAFAFVGMIVVPLVYVFSDKLNFANYRLPAWTGWAGAVVFIAALWLFWRSHSNLGRNWSVTLEVRERHRLITNGVYARVRHPMYAAIWLWGIAQALLLHNWVAGFSHLASFATLYFLRVPREEQMMLDYFGDEYRAYMDRTGRIAPRLSKQ